MRYTGIGILAFLLDCLFELLYDSEILSFHWRLFKADQGIEWLTWWAVWLFFLPSLPPILYETGCGSEAPTSSKLLWPRLLSVPYNTMISIKTLFVWLYTRATQPTQPHCFPPPYAFPGEWPEFEALISDLLEKVEEQERQREPIIEQRVAARCAELEVAFAEELQRQLAEQDEVYRSKLAEKEEAHIEALRAKDQERKEDLEIKLITSTRLLDRTRRHHEEELEREKRRREEELEHKEESRMAAWSIADDYVLQANKPRTEIVTQTGEDQNDSNANSTGGHDTQTSANDANHESADESNHDDSQNGHDGSSEEDEDDNDNDDQHPDQGSNAIEQERTMPEMEVLLRLELEGRDMTIARKTEYVKTLADDKERLTREITSLRKREGKCQKEKDALQAQIDSLQEQLAEGAGKYREERDELQARIDALRVEKDDLSDRLRECEEHRNNMQPEAHRNKTVSRGVHVGSVKSKDAQTETDAPKTHHNETISRGVQTRSVKSEDAQTETDTPQDPEMPQRHEDCESERSFLQGQLAQRMGEIDHLHDLFSGLRGDIKDVVDERNALQKEKITHDEQKKSLEDCETSRADLEGQLATVTTRYATLVASNETSQLEITNLTVQRDQLITSLQTRERQDGSNISQDLATWESERTSLQGQLASATNESTTLRTSIEALAQQVSGLTVERDALAVAQAPIAAEIDNLNQLNTRYKSAGQALQAERDNLRERVASLTSERVTLNQQVTGLTEASAITRRLAESLVAERDGLQERVTGLTTEEDALRSERDASYQSITRIQSTLHEVHQELQTAQTERNEAQDNLRTSGQENTRLQAELEQVQSRLTNAETASVLLNAQINDLPTVDIPALQGRINQLEIDLSDSQVLSQTERDLRDMLGNERDEALREQASLQLEVDRLQEIEVEHAFCGEYERMGKDENQEEIDDLRQRLRRSQEEVADLQDGFDNQLHVACEAIKREAQEVVDERERMIARLQQNLHYQTETIRDREAEIVGMKRAANERKAATRDTVAASRFQNLRLELEQVTSRNTELQNQLNGPAVPIFGGPAVNTNFGARQLQAEQIARVKAEGQKDKAIKKLAEAKKAHDTDRFELEQMKRGGKISLVECNQHLQQNMQQKDAVIKERDAAIKELKEENQRLQDGIDAAQMSRNALREQAGIAGQPTPSGRGVEGEEDNEDMEMVESTQRSKKQRRTEEDDDLFEGPAPPTM